MSGVFHRSLFIQGPAGALEAMLWTSRGAAPARAAVVCHPHPLYGGTLHNKVVFQAAKSLHRQGLPVLRFNFRGVGASAGTHDAGRGEADDVRAALNHVASKFPAATLVLAGFSFGAWVGLRVGCAVERVTELIGLGLPVNNADFSYLHDCRKPKLFIHGSADEHGAIEKVKVLFEEMPEPKRLEVVAGANHFFTGKLSAVDAAIRDWMQKRSPE